jgi:hypothetical protein
MKSLLNLFLSRAKEPSTFAGVSAIAIALGMSTPAADAVSTIVAGVSGLLAVVLGERKA